MRHKSFSLLPARLPWEDQSDSTEKDEWAGVMTEVWGEEVDVIGLLEI